MPPICHAEQAAKGRIADEGQKPANRPETGKANRGWLTAERAKAIGKIGADKSAASKRGKFSEKTLRRRFKDENGIPRLVRSGDDVLTIANSQVVAVETEVQDDLAA